MRSDDDRLMIGIIAILLVVFIGVLMNKYSHSDHIQTRADPVYCMGSLARVCARPAILRNEQEQCERVYDSRGCCAYRNQRTGELLKFDICQSSD